MAAIRRRAKNFARGLLSYTPWSGKGWGLVSRREWSIGLVRGDSPWAAESCNTSYARILTRHDVRGPRSELVADPFLISERGYWYLFFETFSAWRGLGEIAVARSDDLLSWQYLGIGLSEPFHLSYPYVFRHEGEIFMVPEAAETKSVRLYRATEFPLNWTFERTLLAGRRFHDPSLVHYQDRWWLFVETAAKRRYDTLRLYQAPALTGPWVEHPASPVIRGDARSARPAGRILQHGADLYRFAQDCSHSYGQSVSAFRITTMSPTEYTEQRVVLDVFSPGADRWRSLGMHHVDAHLFEDGTWVAAADGLGPSQALSRVVNLPNLIRARRMRQ